ncbi:hypothetical protein Tco_0334294, partial [Tanacetum coccineum]
TDRSGGVAGIDIFPVALLFSLIFFWLIVMGVALLLVMYHDGSAPTIRLVMAFNTVLILLVISLCCCLKSASNLDNLESCDAMKLETNPSRFD